MVSRSVGDKFFSCKATLPEPSALDPNAAVSVDQPDGVALSGQLRSRTAITRWRAPCMAAAEGQNLFMQTTNDIRSAFLDYFARNEHEIVPSSPLVPRNNPTLLFTN